MCTEVCKTCHEDAYNSWEKSPHWKTTLDTRGGPDKQGCESCHGPGSEHVAGGGDITKIFTFKDVTVKEINLRCRACHAGGDQHMNALNSEHTKNGLSRADEFVDVGVSGTKERRHALDRLLSVCRKRSVDAVIVYRYDRFAHSLRQLVNAIEEFRALGIEFASLHEGVDTSTPNGRLVFGIFASIAEFERKLIRDRVRSGLAAAKARSKRLGRRESP